MKAHLNDKFNEGMMAFLGKDYSTCIESLTEVLREDTTHKLALVSRGAAFLRTGQTRTALTDFDRALAVDAATTGPTTCGDWPAKSKETTMAPSRTSTRRSNWRRNTVPPTTAGQRCLPKWGRRIRPPKISRW
jgi:hypothetical protein